MKIRFNSEREKLGCGLIGMPVMLLGLMVGIFNAPKDVYGSFIIPIIVCIAYIIYAINKLKS
ncbi:MAG: hypothetical protein IPO64_04115 [Bacteroidetes bacterium]|nr:hypothetical protein [Bacteroidota bacterium]